MTKKIDEFEKKEVKKRSDNLSDWYTDVVLKAELADYAPVKGTMVIRPYGFAIWENIQEVLNKLMKQEGVQNAYFPLFIPLKLLEKEKEHVEGFSPELALVTIGGGKKLKEPLVVRPTSETIMYEMYSKWIKSWRDLPMKINQWNNVVRWEKRTYLFLRTLEFLWQEGHTAHETEDEARDMAKQALEWYRQIYEEYLGIAVVLGTKSESEKFAGATTTYTIEALMPDGKALQGATSHELGQNFSKVFKISFQDRNSKSSFVWQSSWGLSTRSMGGLFLTHGDDNGLILPPRIASIEVVIIPFFNQKQTTRDEYVDSIYEELKGVGLEVLIDEKEDQSVGRKFNYWEVKGVPLRLEIGEREKGAKSITTVRRDTGEKKEFSRDELVKKVQEILEDIQTNLFEKSKKFLEKNTHEVDDYEEFKEIMSGKRGFIKAYWCEGADCEEKIKVETKASTRLKPFDQPGKTGKCIYCGKESKNIWYFAQAY